MGYILTRGLTWGTPPLSDRCHGQRLPDQCRDPSDTENQGKIKFVGEVPYANLTKAVVALLISIG